MNRKWIRRVLGGLSFTSALFIFQACYGTPQDFEPDVLVEGQVKSKTSGLPVSGIEVSLTDSIQISLTDEQGGFSFYTGIQESIPLQFRDIDSTDNGLFNTKEVVLHDVTDQIYLDIELEEQ